MPFDPELIELAPDIGHLASPIALGAKVISDFRARPHQILISNAIRDAVAGRGPRFVAISVPQQFGKALALNTPIATPDGWTTMGELVPGDWVFGDQGHPVRVKAVTPVQYERPCYAVKTNDGDVIVADAKHEWRAKIDRHSYSGFKDYETEVIARKRWARARVESPLPVELPEVELPIHPYVLGVWLGDGHSHMPYLTCGEQDRAEMHQNIIDCGYELKQLKDESVVRIQGLYPQLQSLELIRNKHIPSIYLRASIEQRMALLQGLIDTDGHVPSTGCIEFTTTREELVEGVVELVHTLGRKIVIHKGRATLYGVDCGPKWRLTFYLEGAARLERKCANTRNAALKPHRYIEAVEVPSVPVRCIEVEGGMFLAGWSMIPTHNSFISSFLAPAWYLELHALGAVKGGLIGIVSADDSLPMDFSTKIRRLIAANPDTFVTQLRKDSKAASYWQTEADGGIIAVGVGGSIVGRPISLLILDDTIKNFEQAASEKHRETVWNFWTCFTEETEILTEHGWLSADKIQKGMSVATLDPETRHMTYSEVERQIAKEFDGELVEMHCAQGVSFSVTPNHRMLRSATRDGSLKWVEAQDLPPHGFFPTGCKTWAGTQPPKTISFGDGKNPRWGGTKKHEFLYADWVEFLGWYLAEGSVCGQAVSLPQKDGPTADEIRTLLKRMKLRFTEVRDARNGVLDFRFYSKPIREYLKSLGGYAGTKRVPHEVLQSDRETILIFLSAFARGDGTVKPNGFMMLYTISDQLRDDLMELGVKAGYSVNTGTAIKHWPDRRVKETRLHRVHMRTRIYTEYEGKKVTRRPYAGMVYCPVVPPHHSILIRRKGRVMWIGQTVGMGRLQPWTVVLVISTRWREDDLIGRLMSTEYEGNPADWKYIRLPLVCEEEGDPIGREVGQALMRPQWDGTQEDANAEAQWLKESSSSYSWETLWQQNPTDPEGTIFFEKFWRYYGGETPEYFLPKPKELDQVIMSWDMAFKSTSDTDYVVGQVWGGKSADRFLIEQLRGRWSFTETLGRVASLADRTRSKYTIATTILVEDKANGPAVIDSLRSKVGGLIEFNVHDYGSKEARAHACQPLLLGGNLYLPSPGTYDWVRGYTKELADFPRGKHDDQCLTGDTIVETPSGARRIDEINSGDTVLGRSGWVEVLAAGLTGVEPVTSSLGLRATSAHPIWTQRGWVPFQKVRSDDTILTCYASKKDATEQSLLKVDVCVATNASGVESKELNLKSEQRHVPSKDVNSQVSTFEVFVRCTTPDYGSTETSMPFSRLSGEPLKWMLSNLTGSSSVDIQMQDNPRIGGTTLHLLVIVKRACKDFIKRFGSSRMVRFLKAITSITSMGTLPTTVSRTWFVSPEKNIGESIQSSEVSEAVNPINSLILNGSDHLLPPGTHLPRAASGIENMPVKVALVEKVYNLQTTDHTYFANGVLVHNCDATTQALLYMQKFAYQPSSILTADNLDLSHLSSISRRGQW